MLDKVTFNGQVYTNTCLLYFVFVITNKIKVIAGCLRFVSKHKLSGYAFEGLLPWFHPLLCQIATPKISFVECFYKNYFAT